jgi:predicted benzoate:H+ symporter BenE
MQQMQQKCPDFAESWLAASSDAVAYVLVALCGGVFSQQAEQLHVVKS